jgi:hypothetical protein
MKTQDLANVLSIIVSIISIIVIIWKEIKNNQ